MTLLRVHNYYATANTSLASFAQNIKDLRTAGCDIIIDDFSYFVESPFQNGQAASVVSPTNAGLLIQSVNEVTVGSQAGALYFRPRPIQATRTTELREPGKVISLTAAIPRHRFRQAPAAEFTVLVREL